MCIRDRYERPYLSSCLSRQLLSYVKKMKAAFLSLALPALSLAAQVTFTNTRRLLFDVDGEQIDAYGSKINCMLDPLTLRDSSLMMMQTSMDHTTSMAIASLLRV